MNKILAVWLSCLAICAEAQTNAIQGSVTNRAPAPRRPSIILIMADNIGYGDLGCYGQTKVKTPVLDRLASEGIRFTSYYAGSPNDEASRASLFTGLEPKHIDSSVSHPLPLDAFTVPTMLKEMGYHTGLIGEWNLGDTPPVQPRTKGFEEFAGFLSQTHARDYYADNIYRQDTLTGSNRLETLPDNWNNAHGLYLPDLLGSASSRYIKIHVPDRFNKYTAFFLCVAYPIPHEGLPPKQSYYDSESWTQPEKDRANMITRMDESIGHILSELEMWHMETNTIVIFTSVGGPQQEGALNPKFFNAAGPLRGDAGSVYEGGIRVPMIIRWPAQIKPGQVSDAPWAAWDLLPTIAEMALLPPPHKTDGVSVMPLLVKNGKMKPRNFSWESQSSGPQQAARMGDWKLVQIGTNAPALYNLKTDVSEKENVAGKNPDVVKKMKSLLGGAEKK